DPRIRCHLRHQSGTHRIRAGVFACALEVLRCSENPVEILSLPDSPVFDGVGRRTFHAVHDRRQCQSIKRGENEMDMVRHNDGAMEPVSLTMIVDAAAQHDIAFCGGKNVPALCAERYKVRFAAFLQMWEVATTCEGVICDWHDGIVSRSRMEWG